MCLCLCIGRQRGRWAENSSWNSIIWEQGDGLQLQASQILSREVVGLEDDQLCFCLNVWSQVTVCLAVSAGVHPQVCDRERVGMPVCLLLSRTSSAIEGGFATFCMIWKSPSTGSSAVQNLWSFVSRSHTDYSDGLIHSERLGRANVACGLPFNFPAVAKGSSWSIAATLSFRRNSRSLRTLSGKWMLLRTGGWGVPARFFLNMYAYKLAIQVEYNFVDILV